MLFVSQQRISTKVTEFSQTAQRSCSCRRTHNNLMLCFHLMSQLHSEVFSQLPFSISSLLLDVVIKREGVFLIDGWEENGGHKQVVSLAVQLLLYNNPRDVLFFFVFFSPEGFVLHVHNP